MKGSSARPVILTPSIIMSASTEGVELTTSYDKGPFSYYGNLAIAQQKAEKITSAQFNFTPADLALSRLASRSTPITASA